MLEIQVKNDTLVTIITTIFQGSLKNSNNNNNMNNDTNNYFCINNNIENKDEN